MGFCCRVQHDDMGIVGMRQRQGREHIRIQTSRPVDISVERRDYKGVIINESYGGLFIKMSGRFSDGGKFLSKKRRFSVGHEIEVAYLSPQGINVNRICEIVGITSEGLSAKFKHLGYAR